MRVTIINIYNIINYNCALFCNNDLIYEIIYYFHKSIFIFNTFICKNHFTNIVISFIKNRILEPKKEEKELNIPHYAMPTQSQAKKCVNEKRIDVITHFILY